MSRQFSRDFHIEVAKGNIAGHKIIHKFGRNSASSDGDDVWFSDGTMNWETSAAVVSVVSSDTDDDGNPTSNTGAQTLTIEGLDSSFDELNETITLNGAGAVTTSGSFIRVNRAYVATTGTYHGTNEGIITGTINGNTAFKIEANTGQTQLGRYTVPNGKTAYITKVVISVDSTKTASVELLMYENADDTSQPYSGAKRLLVEFDVVSGEEIFQPEGGIKLLQKTDVWVNIRDVSAAGATSVDVELELLIVDN